MHWIWEMLTQFESENLTGEKHVIVLFNWCDAKWNSRLRWSKIKFQTAVFQVVTPCNLHVVTNCSEELVASVCRVEASPKYWGDNFRSFTSMNTSNLRTKLARQLSVWHPVSDFIEIWSVARAWSMENDGKAGLPHYMTDFHFMQVVQRKHGRTK
jgi:hypothetical protein